MKIKFNSFGRIIHHPISSSTLRKFYNSAARNTPNNYTNFNLAWALIDLEQKQQMSNLLSIINFHFIRLLRLLCNRFYSNI